MALVPAPPQSRTAQQPATRAGIQYTHTHIHTHTHTHRHGPGEASNAEARAAQQGHWALWIPGAPRGWVSAMAARRWQCGDTRVYPGTSGSGWSGTCENRAGVGLCGWQEGAELPFAVPQHWRPHPKQTGLRGGHLCVQSCCLDPAAARRGPLMSLHHPTQAHLGQRFLTWMGRPPLRKAPSRGRHSACFQTYRSSASPVGRGRSDAGRGPDIPGPCPRLVT